MPDLNDGESVEMQGSAARPYVLTNTGGVYSYSCPAWRNQSLAIEQSTCKHLRKLRGDEAEKERTGGALPTRAKLKKKNGPPLLLAEKWDNTTDLTDWWISEKLDGVRAYWDGKQFLSRQGNVYHAPDWFLEGLPDIPLDGELWIDRKKFQRTVSIVRRQDKSEHWKDVRYLVFDAPQHDGDFETRLEFLADCLSSGKNADFAQVLTHELCRSLQHLEEELARVEQLGGEGLMLRQPNSRYHVGRSLSLLKVKTFHDTEALVIGYQAGRGKHKGKMGALKIELKDGTQLKVGTGFSDQERAAPPGIGNVITLRYQELTDAGVPRFLSFIRVRNDKQATTTPSQTTAAKIETGAKKKTSVAVPAEIPNSDAASRYFEFVAGSSQKFWEIAVDSTRVTARYGRIGTNGQTRIKAFNNDDAAQNHAEKMIEKKTADGYTEAVSE